MEIVNKICPQCGRNQPHEKEIIEREVNQFTLKTMRFTCTECKAVQHEEVRGRTIK